MKSLSLQLYQNLRSIVFNDSKKQYILFQKDKNISVHTLPFFLKMNKVLLSSKELQFYNNFIFKQSTLQSYYSINLLKLIRYFAKLIKIRGIGFRSKSSLNKKDLILKFGTRSAEFVYKVDWQDIRVLSIKKNRILVYGNDLLLVNESAQRIKELKEINIYTGKGFRFRNEKVRKKVGKEKRI